MEDFKNRIEAILFSSGKKMSVDEISKLCRATPDEVRQHLHQLKGDYDSKNSSLLLVDEGDGWKLTVREQYASVVRKIVAETELTRTMIETLAVIAWKAPVLQSEVIRIRTNKAYDHLDELERTGFISRAKHGRTRLVKLTERFFSYFDLKNSDEVKAKFKVQEPEQKQEQLPVASAEGAASQELQAEQQENQAQPKENDVSP